MENEPSGFILPDNPGLTARALLGPLIADAPIGLALVDDKFRYVFINETQAGFNEMPVQEHLGKTVRKVLGDALWQQLEPSFQRSLRGSSLRSIEITGVSQRQPGVRRHFLISFYPVRSDRRTVTGVGTVVTDITERKQSESLIAGQNRILEGIATDSPLHETLTALASLVEDQSPTVYITVLLKDKDEDILQIAATPRLPFDFAAKLWERVNTGSLKAVEGIEAEPCARTMGSITVGTDNKEVLADTEIIEPTSCWIMPVQGENNEELGAFGVFFTEMRGPDARECSFVATAVHTARIAIERDRELIRRRQLLRDMLSSLTEGRLLLCLSPQDLPAPLPTVALPSMVLSSAVLRDLRHTVSSFARQLNMPEEKQYDLEVAVGEAAMNAVVHADAGTAEVFTDTEDARLQVWIHDAGNGIAEESLHRATLERGFSTGKTLGHGFWMILNTIDKVYLLTGPDGTTIVLEQGARSADPDWMSAF